jgi:AAA+ superfamily predicted ATPase
VNNKIKENFAIFKRSFSNQEITINIPPISVLLHGSNGSGKRTAVMFLADMLGCHFCCRNGWSFVGHGESKTKESIIDFLQNCSKYSPCICLITNFDALERTSLMSITRRGMNYC